MTARLVEDGALVASRVLPPDEAAADISEVQPAETETADKVALVLEHPALPFPSFPFEWSPRMLEAAGRLTLHLAEGFLEQGFSLKDATPYNVLFRGPCPVFVDVLSFEKRDPTESTWLAYAQFVRTFVLPLLAARCWGLGLRDTLLTRRDGLEPEDLAPLLGRVERFRPLFLTLVTLPAWLGRRSGTLDGRGPRRFDRDPERARFKLRMLLRHSARLLSRAAGKRARRSAWTGYMEGSVYSPAALQRKEAVARAALEEFRPRAVLDVGCNIGHFSALAAGSGAAVVAIDRDGAVVDATFERARREGLDILPLVVDLARPTPAVGWRNGECPSFLERARGKFDGVLMLAVLHHLAVTEGITIEEILSLTAELTSRVAVIEYVEPTDPMFLRLARGRDHYRGLDRLHFEAVCRRHFEVLRVEPMPDTKRWLYVLGRR